MKLFIFHGAIKPTPGGPNEHYVIENGGGLVWTEAREQVEAMMREHMRAHGWTVVAAEYILEVPPEYWSNDPASQAAYREAQRNGVYVNFRGFETTEDDMAGSLEHFGPEVVEDFRLKRRGLRDKNAPVPMPSGTKIYIDPIPGGAELMEKLRRGEITVWGQGDAFERHFNGK